MDRVEVYSKAELVIDPSLNIQQDDKSNDAAKVRTIKAFPWVFRY